MILVRAFIFFYIQSVFSRNGLKLVTKGNDSNFVSFLYCSGIFFVNYFIILRIALSCSFLKNRFQYLLRKKENYVQYLFCCLGKPGRDIGLSIHLVFQQDLFRCQAFSATLLVSTRRHSLSRPYPLQWAVPVAYDRWQKPTGSTAGSLHSDTSGAPDSLSPSWEPFCYTTAIIHLPWSIWNESTR